ncbi:hypothetical protein HYPGJ_20040 [Hyphomicrobium sp. GJ21]|nr:hypothetical protein HYPGJ_20040 [Hyphomicrobium sp. GJ21]
MRAAEAAFHISGLALTSTYGSAFTQDVEDRTALAIVAIAAAASVDEIVIDTSVVSFVCAGRLPSGEPAARRVPPSSVAPGDSPPGSRPPGAYRLVPLRRTNSSPASRTPGAHGQHCVERLPLREADRPASTSCGRRVSPQSINGR